MRLLGGNAKKRVPILMYHSISDNLFAKSHPYYQINASPKVFGTSDEMDAPERLSDMNLTEMLAAMETGQDFRRRS